VAETRTDGADLRDQNVVELMSRLGSELGTLVRQEMELARAELTERVDAVREEVAEAAQLARAETAAMLGQAKTDMAVKGKKAGIGLGMFGGAGVAALLALGTLSACLVLVLNRVMAADLAALIVTLAWAAVAAVAALMGREKVHEAGGLDAGRYVPRQTIDLVKDDLRKVGDAKEQLLPTETIETVKEDVEWAKTRGKSDAR
jgi:hypothetical protein